MNGNQNVSWHHLQSCDQRNDDGPERAWEALHTAVRPRLVVDVPVKLTQAQKEALQAFDDAMTGKENSKKKGLF